MSLMPLYMFGLLFVLVFAGLPVSFALITTAVGFGWLMFGDVVFLQLYGALLHKCLALLDYARNKHGVSAEDFQLKTEIKQGYFIQLCWPSWSEVAMFFGSIVLGVASK